MYVATSGRTLGMVHTVVHCRKLYVSIVSIFEPQNRLLICWGDGAADGSKQNGMRPQMTGWRLILATMALVVFVSTSLGAVQRFEKPHSRASSTCSATEVKQSPHADTNRVALVIGNFNYPDADMQPAQTGNDACALASALRKDGFDVDLVQNATRNDMQRAIERLEAKVRHDS